jgi:hypothetical protein
MDLYKEVPMRNGMRVALGAALLVALTPLTATAQDEDVPADSATMGADIIVLDDLAERLALSAEVREQIRPHVVALSGQLATLADLKKREKGELSETERTALKEQAKQAHEAFTTHKTAVKEALNEEQRAEFGTYLRERAASVGLDFERHEGEKMEKKEP